MSRTVPSSTCPDPRAAGRVLRLSLRPRLAGHALRRVGPLRSALALGLVLPLWALGACSPTTPADAPSSADTTVAGTDAADATEARALPSSPPTGTDRPPTSPAARSTASPQVDLPEGWDPAQVGGPDTAGAHAAAEGQDYDTVQAYAPDPATDATDEAPAAETLAADGSMVVCSRAWPTAGVEPTYSPATCRVQAGGATTPIPRPPGLAGETRERSWWFTGNAAGRYAALETRYEIQNLGDPAWRVLAFDSRAEAWTTIATWSDVCSGATDADDLSLLVGPRIGTDRVAWVADGPDADGSCSTAPRTRALYVAPLTGGAAPTTVASGVWQVAVSGSDVLYAQETATGAERRYRIVRRDAAGASTTLATGLLSDRQYLEALAADGPAVAWAIGNAAGPDLEPSAGAEASGGDVTGLYAITADGGRWAWGTPDVGTAELGLSGGRLAWSLGSEDGAVHVADLSDAAVVDFPTTSGYPIVPAGDLAYLPTGRPLPSDAPAFRPYPTMLVRLH